MPQETQTPGATSQDSIPTQENTPDTPSTSTPTQETATPQPESSNNDNSAPELSPADIIAEYERHLSGDTNAESSAQPNQSPGAKPQTYNSKRKFEGLDENEKRMFDRMSTEAYEHLYPKYLKSKQLEGELNSLREQLAKTQEVSFYDQEDAWKITPEYNQIKQTVDTLAWEEQFWEQQLIRVEETLLSGDPDTLKDARVAVLESYDQNGRPQFVELPVTPKTKALISARIAKANSLLNTYNDKLNGLQGSYKEKYSGYLKNLKDVAGQMFKGYPEEKLQKLATKKLEAFPSFVRARPEVQLLARVWVLQEALIGMLNKNRAGQITNQLKNSTAANNGPRDSGLRGAGNTGGETIEAAAEDLNKYLRRTNV